MDGGVPGFDEVEELGDGGGAAMLEATAKRAEGPGKRPEEEGELEGEEG